MFGDVGVLYWSDELHLIGGRLLLKRDGVYLTNELHLIWEMIMFNGVSE